MDSEKRVEGENNGQQNRISPLGKRKERGQGVRKVPNLISAVIPRGVESVETITVIKTKTLIGRGTDTDPARYLYQFWDLKGNLLAENDEKKR